LANDASFLVAAHELKTPLAVMKTKNEVTLLKPRESEKYIEALKSNNEEKFIALRISVFSIN
jgi:signal transduction histidine kinase